MNTGGLVLWGSAKLWHIQQPLGHARVRAHAHARTSLKCEQPSPSQMQPRPVEVGVDARGRLGTKANDPRQVLRISYSRGARG